MVNSHPIEIHPSDLLDIKQHLQLLEDLMRALYTSRLGRIEEIISSTNESTLNTFDLINKECQDLRRAIEELRLNMNIRMHAFEKTMAKSKKRQTRIKSCIPFKSCLGCTP